MRSAPRSRPPTPSAMPRPRPTDFSSCPGSWNRHMPDIGNYTETTRLVLGEAGKYFALLLFSVLAIRLWRRWTKSPVPNKFNHLLLAGTATVVAAAIGYFSMCQSLGKLYLYYGMSAFRENRLPQAF